MSRFAWIVVVVLICSGCSRAAKWEYNTVNKQEILRDELDKLGADGWELVAVCGGEPYLLPPPEPVKFTPRTYYFKRQK